MCEVMKKYSEEVAEKAYQQGEEAGQEKILALTAGLNDAGGEQTAAAVLRRTLAQSNSMARRSFPAPSSFLRYC